jgi:stearoyl-CoA desaturase (delta-9 desaturase)
MILLSAISFLWYQWDPTKWFITLCKYLRLANNLRVFPSNEIAKGALTMKLKHLKQIQESLAWPPAIDELPVVTWESCECTTHKVPFLTVCAVQEESKTRPLILVSGFIHDVSTFLEQHPGGTTYLTKNSGIDMTASFFGGIYRHSTAAHNVAKSIRLNPNDADGRQADVDDAGGRLGRCRRSFQPNYTPFPGTVHRCTSPTHETHLASRSGL